MGPSLKILIQAVCGGLGEIGVLISFIGVSDLQPDLRISELNAFGFFPVLRFHQERTLMNESVGRIDDFASVSSHYFLIYL